MDFSLSYSYGNQFDVGKMEKTWNSWTLSYKNWSTFNENIENNVYNKDSDSKISELEPNKFKLVISVQVNYFKHSIWAFSQIRKRNKFNFLHIQNGESMLESLGKRNQIFGQYWFQ